MVRDEVLRLADQARQLVHGAVAAGQLAQQLPTQRMARQLKELRRGHAQNGVLHGHAPEFTSIVFDTSSQIGESGCCQLGRRCHPLEVAGREHLRLHSRLRVGRMLAVIAYLEAR